MQVAGSTPRCRACHAATGCRAGPSSRPVQHALARQAPFLAGPAARPQQRGARAQAAAPATASSEEEEQVMPDGYLWYETMILLRPDLDGEARDQELAKFEAYLQQEGAVGIDVLVRAGSQQLAYPIKGFWDGIYVLYTYASAPKTAQGVQKLLSTPAVGAENTLLRHMTFRK